MIPFVVLGREAYGLRKSALPPIKHAFCKCLIALSFRRLADFSGTRVFDARVLNSSGCLFVIWLMRSPLPSSSAVARLKLMGKWVSLATQSTHKAAT
jgi:hypothetical protein